jgi:hypothetical protein
MAGLRFSALQARPTEVLDLTSLTLDEFQHLLPSFEAAFQAHMALWRLDGKPRTSRRYTTYSNCPLPTPDDRLLFILVYLKTYSLQVVQGRLFGMGQSKANQWIHTLLPVLLAAVRALGDAPARSIAELARRLALLESDITAALTAQAQADLPEPAVVAEAAAAASPLLRMTVSNAQSSDPRIRLNRETIIAARKGVIR